jgi:NhaA family Na+:H+ antiporter
MSAPRRLTNFALLFHHAADKGILLLIAAISGMIMANSNMAVAYEEFLHQPVKLLMGNFELSMYLHNWVNDMLMALFFFLVGMEIKREMVEGHLSTRDQMILPFIAATSGVAVPVGIYWLFNHGNPEAMRGWATPAATDIAFAIGMLSLFGRGIPISLRVFLTALAIIDDLMAVVIIALFYTSNLEGFYLLGILFLGVLLGLMNRYMITSKLLYGIVGAILWYCFYKSGIHATVSGVVLGFAIPLYVGEGEQKVSPLKSMEHALHPIIAYFILPFFAFTNSGVKITDLSFQHLLDPVPLGISLGLLLGKQLGIFSTVYLLIKSKIVRMPENVNFAQFYGVCVLCGIGFTMSLFIGILAFENHPLLMAEAKVGILCGSMLAAIWGAIVLKFTRRGSAQEQ